MLTSMSMLSDEASSLSELRCLGRLRSLELDLLRRPSRRRPMARPALEAPAATIAAAVVGPSMATTNHIASPLKIGDSTRAQTRTLLPLPTQDQ